MSTQPTRAGGGAFGAGDAGDAAAADPPAVRWTELSCCPCVGPTIRPSPARPRPTALIARDETTIGFDSFLCRPPGAAQDRPRHPAPSPGGPRAVGTAAPRRA